MAGDAAFDDLPWRRRGRHNHSVVHVVDRVHISAAPWGGFFVCREQFHE
jgi:hypothetical protein